MAIVNTAHGGAATNTTTSATSLAITVTIAIGEFVWVTIATVAGTSTTAISDNSAGGANKYQFFSKKVGASSEISCWFCNKASATATTITATHAASRASGSASTYTGVLGVGQWKDATNAANNNTVTLTNALGSGNLTLAGMGGALSTATWTAVTGTLRNNIAGGGTTTPGSTNIEGSTTTVAASLSSSVSGEAVAIELLSAVLPVAMNLDIENSLAPPIMWSMGGMGDTTRRSLYEVEKESWGLEIELQTYQEDQEYQNIPQQFPPWFDIETEQFDVGLGLIPLPATSFDTEFFPMLCSLYLPDMDTENYNFGFTPQIGGGTQLMGFRGFWSLKAGMGSLEDWSFDSGIVVAAINAFDDVDQAVAQQASGFAADEVERDNWGWLPPMAQVTLDEAHLDHRFKFDGPAELEAITEDFIVEMVSIDELYTGQVNISAIYQDDEGFGFQTAVVTATQPWDGEDNPADRAWSAKQDLDDLSFEPAIWQNPLDESNYDYSVQSNTVWQTTDEDSAQSEFFVTDRVPEDYEQFVVGGQLALYWNDDDASQSTFFSREQYADIDEQFIITTQRLFHEEDFGQQVQFIVSDQTVDGYLAPRFITMEDDGFGMQAPFITSVPFDDGPDQLPLITFVHDDVETFGFNQPVVVVVNPFDQDELIPVARMGYAEDEAFGFEVGWAEAREQEFTVILVSAFLVDDGQPGSTSGFSNTDTDQQPWQVGATNQDDEPFGLNSPFLTANSEPWEQWGQLASPPYPTTYQVELDQHGQQAPFLTAQPFDETDQRGDTWWARDVDDNWAFNTPEVEGELLLEEELQISNQPYPLWQQTEDEQFGERAPFITAQPFDDTLDQIGQPWWAREQTEETQVGQNAPFLTAQPFDEDQFTRQGLVYEDEEVFSFNSALVQGQDEIPSSMDTLSLRQSDVEVGVTIEQDYSDTLGDYTQVLLRISEDEVFGFQTQQLVQQEPDDVPPAKTWLGIDEEVFGFQTSNVFLPWDAEYNQSGQQSYYFGSEDLEKYNWGWMPPMTKVVEDDNPYDSRVQMQSYLVPAMEDEQFSWGLDRSEFYGLGDEAPYFTPSQQRTQYVPELEDEQFSWGFRQAVFTAFDQDEVPVIILQRWGNDEDFGQQVQFISLGQELEPISSSYVRTGVDEDRTNAPVWGFDTVHLEGPNVKFVIFSDEDVFGFQTAVVTVTSAFEQDELLGIEKRMYAEDETFGFAVGFTPTEDNISGANGSSLSTSVTDDEKGLIIDISLSPDESGPTPGYQVRADEEAFGLNVQFLMAWPGEEGQQPNPPQPVTHQKELEQFGQQAPFLQTIGLSPEEQHLPWPPYPTTYQVELEQVGLNAPFIQAVSLDWDIEQGSKYWAPWAIDHNDYNVGQISIGFMVPKIWNFTVACTIVMAQWSVRAMQQVWQMEAEGTVAIQDCEVRAQIEVMDIQVIAQVQIQDFQVRA